MPTSTYSTQLFRGLVAGALATAMAVVIGACSPRVAQAPAAAALPVAPVLASLPPPVAVTRDVPGQVEAAERIALRPRIGGIVRTVAFAEGARVRKGDLLVQLDPAPYAAALAAARADLQRADAHARSVAAETAQAILPRGSGGVPAAASALRELGIAAARAQRAAAAAAAAVRRARLELRLTRIEAPFDGRIGRAEVTMGRLVGPQDRLAELVGDARVFVNFELPASWPGGPAMSRFQARFSVPDAGDLSFEGPLVPRDDGIAGVSGARRVRMELAGHAALVPGRYGFVRLTVPVTTPIAQATP
jgi:RND family efflux transporter MFP subunit